MKRHLLILGMAVLLAATVPTAATAASSGDRSDFSMFDGTDPAAKEIGVACGARQGSSQNPIAFTLFVTVSNWSDEVRVVRVLFADNTEMVRYQIQPHTSFSFSQALGHTKGVDDFVQVLAECPTGDSPQTCTVPSGISGWVSVLAGSAARTPARLISEFGAQKGWLCANVHSQ